MEKIVVCIMGQNCEKYIKMCLESVKNADAIVYCDGGSTDNTLHIVNEFQYRGFAPFTIANPYNQDEPKMNGKQGTFYLNYIKEKYPDYWCLVLDADEVVEDLGKLVSFLQEAVPGVYSVKMRHFHGDLGHEDAVIPEHYVLNRLFKVSEADSYMEVEHPVLIPKSPENQFGYKGTTIWHCAHIQHCFEIKKRYEKNLKHSNIHTPEYLLNWYLQHLIGTYPNTRVNPIDVPEIIWRNFGIDKDIFYFNERGLEPKHFMMTKQ